MERREEPRISTGSRLSLHPKRSLLDSGAAMPELLSLGLGSFDVPGDGLPRAL